MNQYTVRVAGKWGMAWNEMVWAISPELAKLSAEQRANDDPWHGFKQHKAISVTRIYGAEQG